MTGPCEACGKDVAGVFSPAIIGRFIFRLCPEHIAQFRIGRSLDDMRLAAARRA